MSDTGQECRGYLIQENLFLLDQGKQVLEMISPEDYTLLSAWQQFGGSSGGPAGGTVGHHFRHVCNFYQQLCFLDDVAVNYDQRFRDPVIEKNPVAAGLLMDNVIEVLSSWLQGADFCPEIRAISYVVGEKTFEIPSCIDRELRAVADHTLHHYAIIAQILPDRQYALPQNFGLAASTSMWLDG